MDDNFPEIVRIAQDVVKQTLELKVDTAILDDKWVKTNLHPLVNDQLQRSNLVRRCEGNLVPDATHNALIILGYRYKNYSNFGHVTRWYTQD